MTESITESDKDAHYEEFLQVEMPHESMKCTGFVRSLLRRNGNDMPGFVLDRSLEFINNRAERATRSIVKFRKASSGSRAGKGTRDFARVCQVLESRRNKGRLQFRADPG